VHYAGEWGVVLALKGATSWIAQPDGHLWRHQGGHPGLATSGSGDVLAGIITGLTARGATLVQACAWGVMTHAQAGQQLAKRIGPLGFLARELLPEIPAILARLQRGQPQGGTSRS
jgi:NAD(P)H-hydrate repair Nnr-like enzyme with NAD(P)H-hydrate dehydratase domain